MMLSDPLAYLLPSDNRFQVWVYIVDDSTMDIRVLLQHIEEHCSTSHKRLNICHIIPIFEICR